MATPLAPLRRLAQNGSRLVRQGVARGWLEVHKDPDVFFRGTILSPSNIARKCFGGLGGFEPTPAPVAALSGAWPPTSSMQTRVFSAHRLSAEGKPRQALSIWLHVAGPEESGNSQASSAPSKACRELADSGPEVVAFDYELLATCPTKEPMTGINAPVSSTEALTSEHQSCRPAH